VQSLISKRPFNFDREYWFRLTGSNTIGFLAWSSSALIANLSTTTVIAPNQWYFIALTIESGLVKLYLNGVLEAQATLSGTISGDTIPLGIGLDQSDAGATRYLNGFIDEFKFCRDAAVYRESFTPPVAPSDFPVS
jgi:hypothetical protein